MKNNIHPTASRTCRRGLRRLYSSACAVPDDHCGISPRHAGVHQVHPGCLGSFVPMAGHGTGTAGASEPESGHARAGGMVDGRVWKCMHVALCILSCEDTLMNIARTSLSSKFIGSESAAGLTFAFFSSLPLSRVCDAHRILTLQGCLLPDHRGRCQGCEGSLLPGRLCLSSRVSRRRQIVNPQGKAKYPVNQAPASSDLAVLDMTLN